MWGASGWDWHCPQRKEPPREGSALRAHQWGTGQQGGVVWPGRWGINSGIWLGPSAAWSSKGFAPGASGARTGLLLSSGEETELSEENQEYKPGTAPLQPGFLRHYKPFCLWYSNWPQKPKYEWLKGPKLNINERGKEWIQAVYYATPHINMHSAFWACIIKCRHSLFNGHRCSINMITYIF